MGHHRGLGRATGALMTFLLATAAVAATPSTAEDHPGGPAPDDAFPRVTATFSPEGTVIERELPTPPSDLTAALDQLRQRAGVAVDGWLDGGAGDVDGDGDGDVLVQGSTAEGTAVVEVRDGPTGHPLTSVVSDLSYATGQVAREGDRSVLVVAATDTPTTPHGGEYRQALSLHTLEGDTRWERTSTASYLTTPLTFQLRDHRSVVGTVARPDGMTVVETAMDLSYDPLGYSETWTLRLLDGGDGDQHASAVFRGQWLEPSLANGDVDGDGTDDLLLSVWGDGGQLLALSGVDLAVLWSVDMVLPWIEKVGDLDGDGVPDPAVAGGSHPERFTFLQHVVGSASGEVVLEAAGDLLVDAGDLDRDGTPDVVAVEVVFEPEDDQHFSAGFRYQQVMGATGRPAGTAEFLVSLPFESHAAGSFSYRPVGDLDGDGALDVVHHVEVETDAATTTDSHGVATGVLRSLWTPAPERITPLGAAVDGDGDDLAVLDGGSELTVLAGTTLTPVWSTEVEASPWQVEATDLDGDGHAEVLTNQSVGDGRFGSVFAGTDGELLWWTGG